MLKDALGNLDDLLSGLALAEDDFGEPLTERAMMIDTRRLSYAGASSDPLAALVFSPFPEPADTVIVNGRKLGPPSCAFSSPLAASIAIALSKLSSCAFI